MERFFQRMLAGREARKTVVPWMCFDLLVFATMCAEGMVEYETKPYCVVLRDEIACRAASICPSKICTCS